MEKLQEPRISLKAAINSTPSSSHSYDVNVPLDHCYGKVAHGGLLVSTVLSAVKNHFSSTLLSRKQPHTFDIQLSFLRFVTAGKAQVKIKDVRLGSRTSTVHFDLRKDGVSCVVGYASNNNMNTENGFSYPTKFRMQDPPPPAKFPDLLNDTNPQWVSFTFPLSRRSYLNGGAHVRWFTPANGPDNPSIIDIWFTPLSPDETFTTEMIGSVADQWGVLAENLHPHSVWTTGYLVTATKASDPTLGTDLSMTPVGLHTHSTSMQIIKNLPPEGVKWLFVRAQSKKIQNGRLDVEILVLDQDGDLVAVSQHTVFFTNGPKFHRRMTRL